MSVPAPARRWHREREPVYEGLVYSVAVEALKTRLSGRAIPSGGPLILHRLWGSACLIGRPLRDRFSIAGYQALAIGEAVTCLRCTPLDLERVDRELKERGL